jgi:hypothetical protein
MVFIYLFLVFLNPLLCTKDNYYNYPFQLAQMKKLQSRHTWYTGSNERMNDKFIKRRDSPDLFVSYLSFLRDSSQQVNENLVHRKMQTFLK